MYKNLAMEESARSMPTGDTSEEQKTPESAHKGRTFTRKKEDLGGAAGARGTTITS